MRRVTLLGCTNPRATRNLNSKFCSLPWNGSSISHNLLSYTKSTVRLVGYTTRKLNVKVKFQGQISRFNSKVKFQGQISGSNFKVKFQDEISRSNSKSNFKVQLQSQFFNTEYCCYQITAQIIIQQVSKASLTLGGISAKTARCSRNRSVVKISPSELGFESSAMSLRYS